MNAVVAKHSAKRFWHRTHLDCNNAIVTSFLVNFSFYAQLIITDKRLKFESQVYNNILSLLFHIDIKWILIMDYDVIITLRTIVPQRCNDSV